MQLIFPKNINRNILNVKKAKSIFRQSQIETHFVFQVGVAMASHEDA